MLRVRTIKPGKFDARALWAELVGGVEETNNEVQANFDATTFTWDNRPVWVKQLKGVTPLSQKIVGSYWTEDQIYEWVSEGTPPHDIYPVNAQALSFPGVFAPKTIPGVIGSGGGYSGGSGVIAKHVRHPGTKARNFDEAVKNKMEPIFTKNMDAALERAARASGHYYA